MSKEKTKIVNIIITVVCLVIGVGIASAFIANGNQYASLDATEFFMPLLCGIGLAVGASVFIVGFILSTKCPSCESTFVTKRVGKQETGRKKGYKTVTREEKNSQGDVTRKWDEQIRILTVDYLNTHKCSSCGHSWTTTSVEEFDTFDE